MCVHRVFKLFDKGYTDYTLSNRNLQGAVSFSKRHASTGEKKSKAVNPSETLFSQLLKKIVQARYEKYWVDFEMFEYGISEYVNYASDSDGLMPDVIDAVIVAKEKTDVESTSEITVVNPWLRIHNQPLPLNLIFSICLTYCDKVILLLHVKVLWLYNSGKKNSVHFQIK